MVAALTGWIKSIIFVILFASFLELLLPNSSIQKFVRVVMGLFIMMTILNPVVELIDNDFGSEQAVFAPSNFNNFNYFNQNEPDVSELRQKQARLAREHYLRDLAKQIRATVLSIEGVSEAKIVISPQELPELLTAEGDLKPVNQNFMPQVSVLVVVESQAGLKNIEKKTIKETKIDKIAIENPGAENAETASLNPQVREKIRRTISELYHIRLENIEVNQMISSQKMTDTRGD